MQTRGARVQPLAPSSGIRESAPGYARLVRVLGLPIPRRWQSRLAYSGALERGRALLEGGDIGLVLERQADIIQTVQQAVPPE